MSQKPRIYLDHAATSWPKAPGVLDAVDAYAREVGAAAGRGDYRSAGEAARIVGAARRSIAQLIQAESSDCISLHSSGTAALNAAIFGLVSEGCHVITTAADHNSVLRPLRHLQETLSIDLTVVPCDCHGQVSASAVIDSLRDDTRLVVVSHASNVTGAVQRVADIGQAMHESPALFMVDAAQTLGYLPVDVAEMKCDVLGSPGHKGIRGPLGTGFLYVAENCQFRIAPSIFGGTGSQSESLEMPLAYPSKMEAGNLNVPALAGLTVAADIARQVDYQELAGRLTGLSQSLHDGLKTISAVTVHSIAGQLPVASLSMDSMQASDIAAILDAEFSIETRAGLHCAALIQEFLGCPVGGTLRISGSPHTTDEEIEAVIQAVREIAS